MEKSEVAVDEVPVLVVSAGPVGASMSLLLARQGVRSLLAERRNKPTAHPSGHVINARTMEIWRELLPQLSGQITGASAPIHAVRHVHWCTRLAGRRLGYCLAVPESERELQALLQLSPTRPVHFPQHRLEPLLWEQCRRERWIDFRAGSEWLSSESDGAAVTSTLRRAEDGTTFRVRSRFVIAADGARSAIRGSLGIAMPGPVLQHVISIHFRANLQRFTQDCGAGVLFWVYNGDVVGPLIHHMDDDWVFMLPYQPPQQTLADFPPERCLELLRQVIGSRAVDIAIRSVGSWCMTTQVAERYRAGNVLLVGDAAHRFPPTGGFGTNTGVQDAHNLAWKIRAVLAGVAHDALLDSYETERRPIAQRNADHSSHNHRQMDAVNRLVGLSAERARIVENLARARWFTALPPTIQASSVRLMWRAALRGVGVLERDSARARRVRALLPAAIASQHNHFFARGQEMGFHYERGIVVPEPTPKPQIGDGVRDYLPTTWPGCRLPHAELRMGQRALSTLDLARSDALVLIVERSHSGPWRRAVENIGHLYRFPLVLSEISARGAGDGSLEDVHGDWARWRGVDATGAVLLRPDGHVAWRAMHAPEQHEDTLVSVYRRLVGAWSPRCASSDRAPPPWQDPACAPLCPAPSE